MIMEAYSLNIPLNTLTNLKDTIRIKSLFTVKAICNLRGLVGSFITNLIYTKLLTLIIRDLLLLLVLLLPPSIKLWTLYLHQLLSR